MDVFASGSEDLPSYTVEVGMPKVQAFFLHAASISTRSPLLTALEVYLPKPKLAVEGPDGVQASFDFRGAKNTASRRMLTVTLKNDLDQTVYS